MIKKIVRIGMSIFLVLLQAAILYAVEKPLNAVVAVVNGYSITEAELRQEVAKILPMNAGFHGSISPEKMSRFRVDALQKLVDAELQFQDAKAKGIELGKNELKTAVDALSAKFPKESAFKDALVSSGFDEKSITRLVERQLLVPVAIKKLVDDRVTVSDASIKEYYEKNASRYSKPEEFQASHILFKVDPSSTADVRAAIKSRAEAVLKKLKDGADFGNTAAKESDDLSRIKGGDLGRFHAGQMLPEFEDALKKMKVGEISVLIETIYGYHIIRLIDRKAPRQILFDEIKGKIRDDLVRSEKKRYLDEWLSGLKSKSVVTYPGEK